MLVAIADSGHGEMPKTLVERVIVQNLLAADLLTVYEP